MNPATTHPTSLSPDRPARVLVIEDEPDLREAIVAYLSLDAVAISGVGSLAQAQSWCEANDFDVLAELGIGTNPSLNRDYILRHGWSTLVAEKIGGSAHFANGNSKSMGGVNEVPVHIDWVVDQVEITYDFRPA